MIVVTLLGGLSPDPFLDQLRDLEDDVAIASACLDDVTDTDFGGWFRHLIIDPNLAGVTGGRGRGPSLEHPY